MCWLSNFGNKNATLVSVAGCLGYDVLEVCCCSCHNSCSVSVAGCLGYDVLGHFSNRIKNIRLFQLLVV